VVQGNLDQLKSRVLFDVDWLLTRLASTTVSQTIADVLSVYNLTVATDSPGGSTEQGADSSSRDIGILLRLLQLSSEALSVNPLPVEIVARLGGADSSVVQKYPSLAHLLATSRRWLAETESPLVVPLWAVWERPGDRRRRVLEGVTHVLGPVDGGAAVVGYSSQRGGPHHGGRLSVWGPQALMEYSEGEGLRQDRRLGVWYPQALVEYIKGGGLHQCCTLSVWCPKALVGYSSHGGGPHQPGRLSVWDVQTGTLLHQFSDARKTVCSRPRLRSRPVLPRGQPH